MIIKAYTPTTMLELFQTLQNLTPKCKIISGGTDLIIRLKQGLCEADELLYLGSIPNIRDIVETVDGIEIGAMATMTDIANNPLLSGPYAALKHAAADVGAVQIRNSATVGGNLGNASPAGDLMPIWNLLGAEVIIAKPDGTFRREAVSNVFLGPNKIALKYNEAIIRFVIPKSRSSSAKSAFVKLGYRKALTISRIGLAAMMDVDANGIVTQFELLAGAISPTPIHVSEAEAYLIGKQATKQEIKQVGQFLSDLIMEVTPEMFDRDYKAYAAFGVTEDLFEKLMDCKV